MTQFNARAILGDARRAKAQTGRSVLAQIVEMARLRVGGHGITPEYYFNYRLFDPQMPWSEKSTYVGPWIKSRIYRVQDADTAALCSDKLRSYKLFDELGLPYPRLLAATHPNIEFPGIAALTSEAALAHWLRGAAYPFFVKPSVSYLGFGNKLVRSFDVAADRLIFGNDQSMSVADFAARHGAPGKPVMLFQELIRPHPSLEKVIGNRAATARFVVLNDTAEPEILAAGLRIPSGNNMTDNFQSGRSGNMMAFVDLGSGRLRVVLGGLGLNWREVDTHADTGQRLPGFQVPDWDAAVKLVIAASKALPGLKVHGWDVAFSDKGPQLVETNPRGDINLVQLDRQQGLANPRFLRLYPNHSLRRS